MATEGLRFQYEEPTRKEQESGKEIAARYRFRKEVNDVLDLVEHGSWNFPNREAICKVLEAALALVPPYSEREEEWLEHERKVERGDIISGGEEDLNWEETHPRFPSY